MKAALVGCVIASIISMCFAVDYKEDYMDQIIDHFNFESLGNQTYKQRYFYNDTWWDKGKGPIFFYVGNEGTLDNAWKHNGFIHYIAPSHQAFILFVEHRYYGKSMPFGDTSLDKSKIGWLSIEQVLADYAIFLTEFKKQIGAENCPVIAFGASYGGMLAAFMRFKYPNVIQGAISASGPIYQLEGLVTSEPYYEVTTNTFRRISEDCVSKVRAGFSQLQSWYSQGRVGLDAKGAAFPIPGIGGSRNNGLKHISKVYKLCRPLRSDTDYDHFLRWIRNAFSNAAQLDHPFATSSLPANPVKIMCERLAAENAPAMALRDAIGLVYNSSGESPCNDLQKQFIFCGIPSGCGPTPQYKAWEYQGCTEIIQYGGSNGETDMFPVLPFTLETKDKECKKRWNVTPRRNWLKTAYFGKDISLSSNIVFSDGTLDPWAAGGVLQNVSESIRAIIIKDAAHHLDLWYPHPTDSQAVIDARNFEVQHIQKWIREYNEKRKPSFSVKG